LVGSLLPGALHSYRFGIATEDRLGELPGWARDLLQSARVGRLGLLDDDGRPRVLPVTFAVAEGALWTAVDSKPKRGEPARVRFLRERPHAALTVDHYDDDWDRLAWVQALGTVAVLDTGDAQPGLGALTAKYAQYRDERPPGPVLRLDVERAICWRAADFATREDE
jgi:PPOX class probable F420-dependent enzyme